MSKCSILFAFAFCSAFLSSCQSTAPVEDEISIPDADTIAAAGDAPLSKREFPLINNGNVEAVLADFAQSHPQRNIVLHTRFGDLTFRLFDDTPLHTANFLMLIERGYFEGTQFTRIIDDFVIQGGDNDLETEEIKRMLIGGYDLPPEISPGHIHRKGALAMARDYEDNPEKRSSAYNFYIVEGQVLNTPQMMALERSHKMIISPKHQAIYSSVGGAPHLDGDLTVFGQLVDGWVALEKLSQVPTDKSDWPLETILVDFEILD